MSLMLTTMLSPIQVFGHGNPCAQHIFLDLICSLNNTCPFLHQSSPGILFPFKIQLRPTSVPEFLFQCFPHIQPILYGASSWSGTSSCTLLSSVKGKLHENRGYVFFHWWAQCMGGLLPHRTPPTMMAEGTNDELLSELNTISPQFMDKKNKAQRGQVVTL